MALAKPRSLLIPIDHSVHSKRAVQWYIRQFARQDDTVHLLHVAEPQLAKHSQDPHPADYSGELSTKIKESMRIGEEIGNEFKTLLKQHGIETNYIMHFGNKPGEQIVQIAAQQKVDVVLIGSRGLGTIRRTVLGSVSDYVLHHSAIPTILVPPQAT